MRRAALFVQGRVVLGVTHGDAFGQLTEIEQSAELLISGFFDPETQEFEADDTNQHFYDKEICLIRHAQPLDLFDPDTSISPEGVEQAEQVASFLTESVDLEDVTCITSPLLRCLQTAQIIYKTSHLTFEVDPCVMETPPVEFHLKNHHELFPFFNWSTFFDWDLCPESPSVFLQRTRSALRHLPHRCIIVTHLGTICNISRLALCEQKAQKVIGSGLPPASVTYIKQQDVRCMNENKTDDRPTPESGKDSGGM
jgi:broad specificity phosphatase PhoE